METKKLLKRTVTVSSHADLGFELLQGSTKVHLNHLLVTGLGSYAAHKAMDTFYNEVKDLADDFIEQYQGATEELMTFPIAFDFPVMKTPEDCLSYLRTLYKKVNLVQVECPYSEIVNTLDEVKSLINSTKYKLLFLK
jgi:hypothetical protein